MTYLKCTNNTTHVHAHTLFCLVASVVEAQASMMFEFSLCASWCLQINIISIILASVS